MFSKGPNLTIHQFRVFDAVVRNGSLTKAAVVLDTPQPSISRLIAKLEQDVGTALINRSRQGATLTPAGKRFYQNALQVVHYHDLAIEEARSARGLLAGEVRVAAPDSVGGVLFAPLARSFKADHPEVRLRVFAAQSTEIGRMLAAESIDIGIVADTHSLPPGVSEPLFREALYLVGPMSESLLKKPEVPLADVLKLPLILNSMPGGLRPLIDHGFSQLGIQPQVEFEIDANNSLLTLLAEGAGYSIMPYSFVATLPRGARLGAARLIDPSLIRTLSMVAAPVGATKSVVREVSRRMREVVKQVSARAHWSLVNPD